MSMSYTTVFTLSYRFYYDYPKHLDFASFPAARSMTSININNISWILPLEIHQPLTGILLAGPFDFRLCDLI